MVFSYIILVCAVIGVVINLAAIVIIRRKKNRFMFHDLLSILTIGDVAVVICCALLFALPNLWPSYATKIYPYISQYVFPLMHMAVMCSVYSTILMSFERYIRICYHCQLRETQILTDENVKFYKLFVVIFPILFYIPKFFEVQSYYEVKEVKMEIDCRRYLRLAHLMKSPPLWSLILKEMSEDELKDIEQTAESCIKTLTQEALDQEVAASDPAMARGPDRLKFGDGAPTLPPIKVNPKWMGDQMPLFRNVTTSTKRVLVVEPTSLRKNVYYYKIYYVYLNTFFASILPLALLLFLNMSTASQLIDMSQQAIQHRPVTHRESTAVILNSEAYGNHVRHSVSSSFNQTIFDSKVASKVEVKNKVSFENSSLLSDCRGHLEHLRILRRGSMPLNRSSSLNHRHHSDQEHRHVSGTISSAKDHPPPLIQECGQKVGTGVQVGSSGPGGSHYRVTAKLVSLPDLHYKPRNDESSRLPNQQREPIQHQPGLQDGPSRPSGHPLAASNTMPIERVRVILQQSPRAFASPLDTSNTTLADLVEVASDSKGAKRIVQRSSKAQVDEGSSRANFEKNQPEFELSGGEGSELLDTTSSRPKATRRVSIFPSRESEDRGRINGGVPEECCYVSVSPCKKSEPLRRESSIVAAPPVDPDSKWARVLSIVGICCPVVNFRFNSLISREIRKELRLARISLWIVWLFIFSHVWKLIPTAYETFVAEDRGVEFHSVWPKWLKLVESISHSLITINSSLNFIVYVVL